MEKEETKLKLNKIIADYSNGIISRIDLRNQMAELESLDEELQIFINALKVWSVKQDEEDFSKTRTLLINYFRDNDEPGQEPWQGSSFQRIVKEYLISQNFVDGSTEDKFKPVIKDLLKKYFEDEVSEFFMNAVTTVMMFEFTKIGYNMKDGVLLTIMDDIQDWDIFWKEDEFTYIETDLKEYLEHDTGDRAMNQDEYYEKAIKPYIEVKNRADKVGKEVGLNNEQRQTFRNYIIHNHIHEISDEQLLKKAKELSKL
ncbi:MAG: hypothetical protein ABIM99_05795 [Candidatus Dojkabacteria bacterium]